MPKYSYLTDLPYGSAFHLCCRLQLLHVCSVCSCFLPESLFQSVELLQWVVLSLLRGHPERVLVSVCEGLLSQALLFHCLRGMRDAGIQSGNALSRTHSQTHKKGGGTDVHAAGRLKSTTQSFRGCCSVKVQDLPQTDETTRALLVNPPTFPSIVPISPGQEIMQRRARLHSRSIR